MMHVSNLCLRVIGVFAISVSGIACQQDVLDQTPDPDLGDVDSPAQPNSVEQAAACSLYPDQVTNVAFAPGGGAVSVNTVFTWKIPGDTLMYPGGTVQTGKSRLTMQTDGNLVLYDECGRVRWSTNTWGHPNAFVWFQTDGNLVVYDSSGMSYWPIWSTATCCHSGWTFHVQADGNLVIYAPGYVPMWASHTNH